MIVSLPKKTMVKFLQTEIVFPIDKVTKGKSRYHFFSISMVFILRDDLRRNSFLTKAMPITAEM